MTLMEAIQSKRQDDEAGQQKFLQATSYLTTGVRYFDYNSNVVQTAEKTVRSK